MARQMILFIVRSFVVILTGRPKSRGSSLREIVKNLSTDGTTSEDAVRGDIDFIRERNKLKVAVPIGQVLDYTPLKEVLAGLKSMGECSTEQSSHPRPTDPQVSSSAG